MKYDIGKASTVPSIFDSSTNTLCTPEDVIIEETLVRYMKDMRELFIDTSDFDDNTPLYYMYNGIYRKAHESLFKQHHLRYEYTVLLANCINSEMMKAHGHIHGIHPVKKTRHMEAYEILSGKGIFELFYYDSLGLHVIMLQVKANDYFIVPSGYYHLSINTGAEPFIFGDLIIDDANSDYGPLKEKKGAPLYVVRNAIGMPEYKINEHYHDQALHIEQFAVHEIPWDNPVAPIPLYAHFLSNPDAFSYLK